MRLMITYKDGTKENQAGARKVSYSKDGGLLKIWLKDQELPTVEVDFGKIEIVEEVAPLISSTAKKG